ncbi:hypothetical protein HY229_06840 [Candidatus Acetothermia bacterium]|nr:hypothetical protein [Candidatus Acetothermia bacterium]MBI3643800.1 hypothetical protein [Candidatus Acetothermia bacterium]
MLYLRIVLMLLLFSLTGCGMISSATSPDPSAPPLNPDVRDLTGLWDVIFHYEVGESVHIPAKLLIQRMDCTGSICNLVGNVESDELGSIQHLLFNYAYYYPIQDLVRIEYTYKTVDSYARTVVVVMDQFPSTKVTARSMAGDFIVYGNEAPATFFNTQDGAILAITKKGKAVHAGQVTAWVNK